MAAAAIAGALVVGGAPATERAASLPEAPDVPVVPAPGDDDAETAADAHGASGHEAEGLPLRASARESVEGGAACPEGAPVRDYDVSALAVDITVNRYLDHDPAGLLYALTEDVGRVRAEEAANARARQGLGEPAVSIGLQGDAIQPLTLRVLPGECLRITLRNDLDQPASFHVHGSQLVVAGTGDPATAANADALAAPGRDVAYEWYVDPDQPEGTHYVHSHGAERAQTVHGLFGAVVVEPAGSTWRDPNTGAPIETGWQAIVETTEGAFREAAIYYHEIGDERYQLLDANGEFVPLVDPITTSYRPGARALNYRSEPFLNRLRLQESIGLEADESVEYSSYSFGDPATPIIRSYVGDDVRQRVVHGGSEVFHVHHVHGGSVRWRRQPNLADPSRSEVTDSQSVGPSEVFDVVPECPAGGCQATAGDFMFHCHIAHHYVSGMWSIWRVYNTLQDGESSTDLLPPLVPLPGVEAPQPAVPSEELVGGVVPDAASLAGLVEPQLPPPGVPRGYDASVWDWTRSGDTYLGEVETAHAWPGYRSPAPGARPPILFDPRTGALAFPHLRPHLGRRPPFAPGHGPEPFASGPGATDLCPSGTRPRRFPIVAVRAPVTINADDGLTDSNGALFVLRDERDDVLADATLRRPLALRVNTREDCVDVLLRSELRDSADDPLNKVGVHIHFVRFDVQGSDGVNVGFNYEQTVRPYAAEGSTLVAPAAAGATTVEVADASGISPGALLGVGLDRDETFEARTVAGVDGSTVRLAEPLESAHGAGEWVGNEFVRYRWFPDAQFGTSYFHDHVRGVDSWRHGLFGALIAEPPGATWTDPATGEPLTSGPVADVHTDEPVGVDAASSFRELLLLSQDDQPLTHVGRSDGASFNLRAEPLAGRAGDPSLVFSSAEHGDPATPILEAYVGDPVVVRNLVGGTNEVTTWHLDGHWFRIEPWSATSPPVNTLHHGISERYDVVVPAAGGPQRRAGDYLYYSGRASRLAEGAWGLLRVLEPGEPGPVPLPGVENPPSATGDVCPESAPVRSFDVHAVDALLPMLEDGLGRVYATADVADAVAAGDVVPEPLVLRAGVGDCIELTVTNRTAAPAGVHPDLLAFDPQTSAGVTAGRNAAQVVEPGATRTYRWYASPEVGEAVALLRDWGDVTVNPALGMYGAVVIGPAGAAYRHPVTGEDLAGRSSWRADVLPVDGEPYRDFALFFQDTDEAIGSHRMPYTDEVEGIAAVNYRSEPLEDRTLAEAIADVPSTPVLDTFAGDPIRLHVVAPWSEQNQVFSLEGHDWPQEPGLAGTPLVCSLQLGGLEAVTLRIARAGGDGERPGTYLYGNHRLPFAEAGQWGVLQVRGDGEDDGLRPLAATGSSSSAVPWFGGALAALVATGTAVRRRRRRRRQSSLR